MIFSVEELVRLKIVEDKGFKVEVVIFDIGYECEVLKIV